MAYSFESMKGRVFSFHGEVCQGGGGNDAIRFAG